jgi:hypothetical protein
VYTQCLPNARARQILALLLSAMAHDMGHDGLNNSFHKNTLSQLAMLYNDQSIQENHHINMLFAGMQEYPEINIFEVSMFSAFEAEHPANDAL